MYQMSIIKQIYFGDASNKYIIFEQFSGYFGDVSMEEMYLWRFEAEF